MADWMTARHRVAIAGRVLDGLNGKPVAGAHLQITVKPRAFANKLDLLERAVAGNGSNPEHTDSTRTRTDGLFFFLDLPPGKYKLYAFVPADGVFSRQLRLADDDPDELFRRTGDKRYGRSEFEAQVSYRPEGFDSFTVIRLPPTGITGKIVVSTSEEAVPMAEVRLKATGERRFTDAEGRYTFTGIYPNKKRKRILQVTALGYRTQSLQVLVDEPGVCKEANTIQLVAEGGFNDTSI